MLGRVHEGGPEEPEGDRAKELLASSDMMSYEIAEAVGYPDPRYFASLFKKRTGVTPSEYRKSLGGQRP